MPRKLRAPKTRVSSLPSPSWVYELLVGESPGCRLPGWPAMFQQPLGEPTADQIWDRHGAALLEVAREHDFEPYALHRRPPDGPGFRRWRDRFLATHRY